MTLTKVEYHLFDSDLSVLERNPSALFHEIDCEVILHFEEQPTLYISWLQANDNSGYQIAIQDETFFTENEITTNMSGHFIWKPLIGKQIEISFLGPEQYILRLASLSQEVFCCVYENGYFGVDVIHIANEIPKAI